MKKADNETIAILMAINSLSTQLEREIQVEDMEKELEILRATNSIDIKLVVALTESGNTARLISKYRPEGQASRTSAK